MAARPGSKCSKQGEFHGEIRVELVVVFFLGNLCPTMGDPQIYGEFHG